MLYAVDIGNSSVSVGLVNFSAKKNGAVQHFFKFTTTKDMGVDELEKVIKSTLCDLNVEPGAIDSAVVCSVVPELDPTFYDVIKSVFSVDPLFVNCRMDLKININLANPTEIGIDRLVNAAAARMTYDDSNIIIIDFGTAITFDCVTKAGEFIGGAIAPGAQLSLDALIGQTSRIGEVEPLPINAAIGKNTVEAVQSGIFHGYIGLVNNIVSKMKEELGGDAKIIATGGGFRLFEDTIAVDTYDEHLTIKGLVTLYK